MDDENIRLLEALATRLTANPRFMAHLLDQVAAAGVDPRVELGLDRRGLAMLAICGVPRPDRRAQDLALIARHTGVEIDRLAALLEIARSGSSR